MYTSLLNKQIKSRVGLRNLVANKRKANKSTCLRLEKTIQSILNCNLNKFNVSTHAKNPHILTFTFKYLFFPFKRTAFCIYLYGCHACCAYIQFCLIHKFNIFSTCLHFVYLFHFCRNIQKRFPDLIITSEHLKMYVIAS